MSEPPPTRRGRDVAEEEGEFIGNDSGVQDTLSYRIDRLIIRCKFAWPERLHSLCIQVQANTGRLA